MTLGLLDAYVLDWHERFSHFTQRWIGIDCFFLGFFMIGVSMIFDITLVTFIVLTGQIRPIFVMFFLALRVGEVTRQFGFVWINKKIMDANKGVKNHAAVCPVAIKIRTCNYKLVLINLVMLILALSKDCLILVLLSSLFEVIYLSVMSSFYFGSCTPLPPYESKTRKVVRTLRESLTPQPGGGMLPDPTPV